MTTALAPAGRTKLGAAHLLVDDVERRLLDGMSATDRERLAQLLERAITNLTADPSAPLAEGRDEVPHLSLPTMHDRDLAFALDRVLEVAARLLRHVRVAAGTPGRRTAFSTASGCASGAGPDA